MSETTEVTQIVDNYTGVDPEEFKDSHKFLAEGLLSPMVPITDLVRLNMFNAHIVQAVNLKVAEIPKVFTGFEQQVGKYSSAIKHSPSDLKLVEVIRKHEFSSFYVFVDEKSKVIHVFSIPHSKRISEYFGYEVKNHLSKLKKNEVLKKGARVFSNSSYDSSENFMYGTNLKSVFLSFGGWTYEDAAVVSETGARKLETIHVEEVKATVNTNNILTNAYGDLNTYKTFPDIGEEVKKGIICSRRTIEFDSMLVSLKAENMFPRHDIDITFFSEEKGIITDIEIFSNTKLEDLQAYPYNVQIVEVLERNLAYYRKIRKTLSDLRKEGYSFSDDAGFYYNQARNMTNDSKRFNDDNGKEFDNIVIKFTITSTKKLTEGSKLTGRYGNKGTVAKIIPDDLMPFTEDGERAEIILNPLGVSNRMNIAQLVEHECNFIGNQIAKKMKKLKTLKEKKELYFAIISAINEDQANATKEILAKEDLDSQKEFFKDVEDKGFFINITPFIRTANLQSLANLYDVSGITPKQMAVNFEGKVIQIETPMTIGEIYFMRLKHDPHNKFSARSGGSLSILETPSKNSKTYKDGQSPYSKTAVRFGEMEYTNLVVLDNPEKIMKFSAQHSSNSADRNSHAKILLNAPDAVNPQDPFNIEDIPVSNIPSQTSIILRSYLKAIGMELVTRQEDQKEIADENGNT